MKTLGSQGFTSSACLRVGYKMKIWDSGFGGKLNVVSPCDAAKQAGPRVIRARNSHVNVR